MILFMCVYLGLLAGIRPASVYERRVGSKRYCAVLAGMLSLDGAIRQPSDDPFVMQTDYIGHLLGAIGGIVYCRLEPQKKKL